MIFTEISATLAVENEKPFSLNIDKYGIILYMGLMSEAREKPNFSYWF